MWICLSPKDKTQEENKKDKRKKRNKGKKGQKKKKKKIDSKEKSNYKENTNTKLSNLGLEKKNLKEIQKMENLLLITEKNPQKQYSKFFITLFDIWARLEIEENQKNLFLINYFKEIIDGLDQELIDEAVKCYVDIVNNLLKADSTLFKSNFELLEKGILHNNSIIGEMFSTIHLFIHNLDKLYFLLNFDYLEKLTEHKDFRFHRNFLIIYNDIFSTDNEFFNGRFQIFEKYLFVEKKDVEFDNEDKQYFYNEIGDFLILILDKIFAEDKPASYELFLQFLNYYITNQKKYIHYDQFLIFISVFLQNNIKIYFEPELLSRCYETKDEILRNILFFAFFIHVNNNPEIFPLYSDYFLARIMYGSTIHDGYKKWPQEIEIFFNKVESLALKFEHFFKENINFFMSLLFSEEITLRERVLHLIFSVLKKYINQIYTLENIFNNYLSIDDKDIAIIAGDLLKQISYIYFKEETIEKKKLLIEFILPYLIKTYEISEIVQISSQFLFNIISEFPEIVEPFFDNIYSMIDQIENSSIRSKYSEIKIKIVKYRLTLTNS